MKKCPTTTLGKTGSTQRIIFDIKWCYSSTFYFEKKVYNLNRYGNLFERERKKDPLRDNYVLCMIVMESCVQLLLHKEVPFLPDLPPYILFFPSPQPPRLISLLLQCCPHVLHAPLPYIILVWTIHFMGSGDHCGILN